MKIKLFLTYILLWHLSMAMQAQTFTLHGRNRRELATDRICICRLSATGENDHDFAQRRVQLAVAFSRFRCNKVLHDWLSKPRQSVLRKPQGQSLQIVLHSSDNTLEGVTVTDTRRQTSQTQEIKKEDLKSLPSTSGNAVEELIQSQAGVSTHNELSSQYNVRGGSFDENSVYINNVEIFRPFLVRSGQQEGISVINPTWWKKSDSLPAATKPVMATRCRRLSTLPTNIPRNSRLPCRRVCLGQAHIGVSNKKMSWSNGLRYKTTKIPSGFDGHKGRVFAELHRLSDLLHIHPNQRWNITLLGNISDNHYNFTPSDRETSFGTMESVKAFKVYFDGREKDVFRTYFGSLNITRNFRRKHKTFTHCIGIPHQGAGDL